MNLGLNQSGAAPHKRIENNVAWAGEGLNSSSDEQRGETRRIPVEVVRQTGHGCLILNRIYKAG